MKDLFKDIVDELIFVLKGNTLDILIPPILFYVGLRFFDLFIALLFSLMFACIMLGIRLHKKEKWYYAVGGIIGTLVAAVMVYINTNASNFFLPDLIGTGVFIVVTALSILIKKPLAMFASHITRGWDIDWFLRKDIYPAYLEVTIFWLGFFILRFIVELTLYLTSTTEELVVANIIMGLPLLIFVLTISYIYGIWRLKTLNGPGIDEYHDEKTPPYKGQRKGF
ncbi:MAG: DUF3159 domain-containing protein [Candidatus Izemoplasma sp.]|nr:DUF3159 domain-containing protein [Candidatus Izemoplasma sp.]